MEIRISSVVSTGDTRAIEINFEHRIEIREWNHGQMQLGVVRQCQTGCGMVGGRTMATSPSNVRRIGQIDGLRCVRTCRQRRFRRDAHHSAIVICKVHTIAEDERFCNGEALRRVYGTKWIS